MGRTVEHWVGFRPLVFPGEVGVVFFFVPFLREHPGGKPCRSNNQRLLRQQSGLTLYNGSFM